MLIQHHVLLLGNATHAVEEVRRQGFGQQAIPVRIEHRTIPYRLVDPQPDELAVQQVVVELFDQLPLATDGVDHLQQQGPQKPLRRNRGASSVGV